MAASWKLAGSGVAKIDIVPVIIAECSHLVGISADHCWRSVQQACAPTTSWPCNIACAHDVLDFHIVPSGVPTFLLVTLVLAVAFKLLDLLGWRGCTID